MNSRNLSKDGETCIHGTCLDMCPPEEMNLRIREKLVHILEVTTEGYKLVKCYSRSAADSNMAIPSNLRPFPTLMTTTQYLLLNVSKRKDVKMSVIYNFLDDRLRSVRQDMTIQRLHPKECVKLLEPMIRFYNYYGYRLCEYPLKEYDPVLNKKYLLECIKWFLTCCDTLEETNIECMTDILKDLYLSKDNILSCDRPLVESLYVLCNLSDIHPLYRYLSLPNHLKRSKLKLAYEIAVANKLGNYVRVWRLAEQLCPLTFAALCLYLPTMQKRGLQVISTAYNSKQLKVPTKVIQQWLGFTSEDEVRVMCDYYGQMATDVVCFNKALFRSVAEVPQPKQHYMARISRLELEDIMFYTI
ncbi:unnamed protein product [Danaus chrysippus]|uniref:(African queen) hypothetical protein n=1 Tax=Danaus chrysippus TaxID=151541 RepID=A0A8J2W8B3_9NEOP|nr:unnamed protein product [Danaus chrysippus]